MIAVKILRKPFSLFRLKTINPIAKINKAIPAKDMYIFNILCDNVVLSFCKIKAFLKYRMYYNILSFITLFKRII